MVLSDSKEEEKKRNESEMAEEKVKPGSRSDSGDKEILMVADPEYAAADSKTLVYLGGADCNSDRPASKSTTKAPKTSEAETVESGLEEIKRLGYKSKKNSIGIRAGTA